MPPTDFNSDASGPPRLELVNWPLLEEPLLAGGCAAGAVLIAVLTGWLADSVWLGVIAAVALAAVLWRQWLPVTFRFGPSGIVQSVFGRSRSVSWRAVARYVVYPRGVLFLPDATGAPLLVTRGLYVAIGQRRQELLEVVAFYLGSAELEEEHEPPPNKSPQEEPGEPRSTA